MAAVGKPAVRKLTVKTLKSEATFLMLRSCRGKRRLVEQMQVRRC